MMRMTRPAAAPQARCIQNRIVRKLFISANLETLSQLPKSLLPTKMVGQAQNENRSQFRPWRVLWPWPMGQDAALMASISSANVACGFHAGDPGRCGHRRRLRKANGVAVGAHPGFPDLVGFGRREMRATPQEVEDFVALSSCRAGRHRRGPGRAAAARQGAWRALQHGVPRSRACRRHRERGRAFDRIADPVWASQLGTAARRRSRGPARRRGSFCRSGLRSGRLPGLARRNRAA